MIINLSLYHNTILAMLITNQHSVHFIYLVQFDVLQFTSVHSVYFDLFWFVWSTSINSAPFNPLWSILSNSVQFGALGPIRSTLVYLLQFVPFISLRSIWSIWSISDHFDPIRCTYLWMRKYKFELRILSIIWVILIVIIW